MTTSIVVSPLSVQQGWAVNENRVRGKEEEYIAANQQKRTRHRFLYSYLPWEPTRVRSIILCIHVLFFLFFCSFLFSLLKLNVRIASRYRTMFNLTIKVSWNSTAVVNRFWKKQRDTFFGEIVFKWFAYLLRSFVDPLFFFFNYVGDWFPWMFKRGRLLLRSGV